MAWHLQDWKSVTCAGLVTLIAAWLLSSPSAEQLVETYMSDLFEDEDYWKLHSLEADKLNATVFYSHLRQSLPLLIQGLGETPEVRKQ